jgi:hypothetical protein
MSGTVTREAECQARVAIVVRVRSELDPKVPAVLRSARPCVALASETISV